MIDVDAGDLKTIQGILKKYIPGLEVRAFGSRVLGSAKVYSDLDLAVVSQSQLDPVVLINLKEAFQESRLPFRVDVIDWQSISTGFQKIINQNYVVIAK